MLSLTDTPLSAIKFDGETYQINLAFDNVIKYLELVEDDSENKELEALKLFFGDQEIPLDPDFIESSFKLINETITKSAYQGDSSKDWSMNIAPQHIYSYEQDADAIYSSFMMQYHIDLLKERGKMHWCVFRALFDGLSEDTPIQRIIELRQKNLTDVPDEQRGKVMQLQQYYVLKLKKPKTEEDVFNNSSLSSAFASLMNTAKGG
ncbi:Gp15 family bacteriophage protein [Lactobacillus gasseri]|uniref:Gp15 family bacteriophage protein n=1 Tax=Lactobacillus gasseri TaxID=1596 RepID=UPI000E43D5AE|nr:Gp15 family bacteriophage protein [Lactobacillus gasseri]MCZ3944423.1 bacteriophage Gp15 family protein [Lactobacillus gasseri]MCZ3947075.1 bacteriophage Gp15 family protein [Lactobacillus gasseri]MCZ3980935.1 bacteriophage Gp15 family protein [Lactobacillus gasseri]MCZ3995095.1 bacteriophage Gp15 family protein [Lactobacillus gasseri]MCZ4003313.1 bacteriophage Gp15 family protein [Lactobacillus gasseri]